MQDRTAPEARREEGFSFIEIMAVVIIIGLLTTLVGRTIFAQFGRAQHTLAGTKIQKIQGALEMYKVDNGSYPSAEQGLEALVTPPTGEPAPRNYLPGGYASRADLVDPWQNPLQYRVPGEHNPHSFDVFSYGADGVEGGEGTNADLGNWDAGA
jgi:general secretion pathway protein G